MPPVSTSGVCTELGTARQRLVSGTDALSSPDEHTEIVSGIRQALGNRLCDAVVEVVRHGVYEQKIYRTVPATLELALPKR